MLCSTQPQSWMLFHLISLILCAAKPWKISLADVLKCRWLVSGGKRRQGGKVKEEGSTGLGVFIWVCNGRVQSSTAVSCHSWKSNQEEAFSLNQSTRSNPYVPDQWIHPSTAVFLTHPHDEVALIRWRFDYLFKACVCVCVGGVWASRHQSVTR